MSFVLQFTQPSGFWHCCHRKDAHRFVRRYDGAYSEGFVPPAVVNGAAQFDGSSGARAAGGAPSGISTQTKPAGASGNVDLRQSSFGVGLNTVQAACTSASPAIVATPQKVSALVHSISSSLKNANLDMHGRLVRKGLVVSWHGFRFHVLKVSRGRCLVHQLLLSGRHALGTEWLDCESVQVVV